jgi:2-keto-4-pentenoate hydratase/2-oxohepta-3-ene-1,7-dioic acid hydratase in catechol pathway
MTTRRDLLYGMLAASAMAAPQVDGATRYVRFQKGSKLSYGLLEGDTVREIRGDLFSEHKVTQTRHKVADLRLMAPCVPPKVLAVGLNYKSHIGERKAPPNPEIFYKPVSCIQHPGHAIVIPEDSRNLHYEGELVVVIGKAGSQLSPQQAKDVIFGVTCGNDCSERDWQNGPQKDLQWWRAKGSDTFGPLGPVIVSGIDYSKLMLQTRLNGEVVQKQSTSDLLFDCPTIVSYISRYVTLSPGDVIYTGTPGQTRAMKPGDVVEVEIEGVGLLRNPVVSFKDRGGSQSRRRRRSIIKA